jgi:hypothetical protein
VFAKRWTSGSRKLGLWGAWKWSGEPTSGDEIGRAVTAFAEGKMMGEFLLWTWVVCGTPLVLGLTLRVLEGLGESIRTRPNLRESTVLAPREALARRTLCGLSGATAHKL